MSIVLFTVVDLETSGLAPPASIVEIGWSRLYFDTDTKQSEIRGPYSRLFRPREEMTSDVIAIHHLTNEMLAPYELCTEDDLRAVLDEERPDFIVASWSAFDRQWFTDEVIGTNLNGKPPFVICTVKAAARLCPEAPSHSNQAMRYELGLSLPEELAMPPHRAGPDSYVTAHVLAQFLLRTRVKELVEWTFQPRFMTAIRFGKHKGTPWTELPLDYIQWCLKQADMDPDALHWMSAELDRREAERAA